jgi:hypothetical protein
MTHPHRWSGRKTGSLVLSLAVLVGSACTDGERLGPSPVDPTSPAEIAATPTLASALTSGITFGTFDLNTELLGAVHNGSLRSPNASQILSLVKGVRAKGGRVVVAMVDPDQYKSGGKFSLSMWKAEISKFKGVAALLQSYIDDGTIIGHYMIDEPDDPSNWGGTRVSPAQLEEMAQHSKSIFPNLATIVRANPGYLAPAQYVDAAWSQYTARRGDPVAWIRSEINNAKARGLELIVSVNALDGGNGSSGLSYRRGKSAMSATELRKYGTALIAEEHGCAFYQWKYNSSYFGRSDIKAAMTELSDLTKARAPKDCRRG